MSPQSATELVSRLTFVWERVMKTAPVAPDANFFDLGGDSLQAVSLLLEIERDTGHRLAITSIYDAPTIADQVDLIESGSTFESSCVVPLKEGSGDPLFIVHGIGGTVLEFCPLADAIDIEGPVYAIQARGLDGAAPPVDTIPEMARHYVEALREIQISGPYQLAGYSFGGLVAFEMARILMEQHGETARVLLIDSYPHPLAWPAWSRIEVVLRSNFKRLKRLAIHPGETISRLRNRLQAASSGAGTVDEGHRRWPYGPDPSLPLALRAVHEAAGAALATYVPQKLEGEVTFLKARSRGVFYPLSPRAIWRNRVRQFVLRRVSGDHVTMIRDHYAQVARHIADWSMESSQSFIAIRVKLAPTDTIASAAPVGAKS